jgi:hypothetical protein
MQIHGSKASSAQFFLHRSDKKDKLFEQGQCDRFDKTLPDFGRPLKIKIGHDNHGAFAGWHLDRVLIQNNVTNEKFNFPCARWLAKDELDHKIELELNEENANRTNTTLNKS